MSAGRSRRQARAGNRSTSRSRGFRWAPVALGLAAVLLVGVGVASQAPRFLSASENNSQELPGPLGGPSIAQDIRTRVGQPAPAFALTDSEGTNYAVTPGQGRPLVLISHMGIT